VIRGTQINFAIPPLRESLASGRVTSSQMGEAFKQTAPSCCPYGSPASTRFNRVRETRLEVWKGKPDLPLSSSLEQPKSRPGDGNRQTVKLNYQNGIAQADVVLPATVDGEVCWLQPVLVTGENKNHWGPSLVTPLALLPIERQGVRLARTSWRSPSAP